MSTSFPTNVFDPACRSCDRLADYLAVGRERHPEYHCAPVPPFGDAEARLLIVGLAPGFHGANASGRPFTGDHAGLLLYRTLHKFGFATEPESKNRHDGLELPGCRITNAVKCVPPQNKPLPQEIALCNRFLKVELAAFQGDGRRVIVALGAIAHGAVLKALGLRPQNFRFAHGAEHTLGDGRMLLDSYHCSRYNTQTRRLTEDMFVAVFVRAQQLLERRGRGTGNSPQGSC